MPRHLLIASEVIRLGSRYASGLLRAEDRVLGAAYTGFKHKSAIIKGVRHGLAGGAVIGNLIGLGGDESGNGVQKPRNGNSSGKPYQARRGRGRNYNYNNKYSRCNCRKRHTRSSYRKRM